MVASDVVWGQGPAAELSRALPLGLRGCERVVAVTVHLPELLLGAAGLLQRLGMAGVQIDVLVAAEATDKADDAGLAALEELAVPGLERHRLALPMPIGPDRGDDVLAAMSELVGFDPDPGVYCLVPAEARPGQTVVADAARRISEVYRMPLVWYTSTTEAADTDLELDDEERRRKSAALAACSSEVTPLSGCREYFGL